MTDATVTLDDATSLKFDVWGTSLRLEVCCQASDCNSCATKMSTLHVIAA